MNNLRSGTMDEAWRVFWVILGIGTVGVAVTAATSLAMLSTKFLVVVLATPLLGMAFVLSGNARLFIFYGLFFLAPWTIKKDFLYVGHMSGAVSFDLHISDPLLFALIAFQIRDRLLGHPRPFRFPRSLWLWIGLIVLGLGNVAFNDLPLPPAHEVHRMVRLLLWMVVLTNEVVRRKLFLHAAYALLLAATVQVGFAYLQVLGVDYGLTNYGQMSKQGMANLGAATLAGQRNVERIGGLMTHPNVLGAYLAMTSAIAMSLLFSPLSGMMKVILSTLWISFTVMIILTLSRAAWVDYAVVVLGVTLLTHANRYARARYFLLRAAVLGGILVIGIAFSGQIISRMTQSVSEGIDVRWEFVEASKKMILEKPIFGFGLNTYTFYQPPYTRYGSIDGMIEAYGDIAEWPVVHNSYLLVWVEQGTVGLILWLWLHIAIIVIGIRNLRLRDPTLHALNVAFLIGFIAIMFDHLVSFFDRLQQGILIWIFAAMIFALDYWRRENETRQSWMPDQPSPPNRSAAGSQAEPMRQNTSQQWLPDAARTASIDNPLTPRPGERSENSGWIINDRPPFEGFIAASKPPLTFKPTRHKDQPD